MSLPAVRCPFSEVSFKVAEWHICPLAQVKRVVNLAPATGVVEGADHPDACGEEVA